MTTHVEAQPDTTSETASRPSPLWNVVLINDDDHTYEYVMEMLMRLFAHSPEQTFLHAQEVDTTGRTIVATTSKERAELKQEQIHGFGRDWRIPRCKGSMSSEIAPVCS